MAKKAETATTKTTSKKTSTKAAKKAAIEVSVHYPGELPAVLSLAEGTTLAQAVEDRNLTGYTVTLRRGASSLTDNSTVLEGGDVLRIGVKTKNA